MVLTFSVVSVFPKFQTLANEFQEKVFETFVVGKGAAIYEYINEFVQRVNDLSILGIVFLLISAVTVMITVEGTLNNIWGVRDKRKGINAFLVYWSMLTLVPILLIAAIAAYTSLYTYLPFGISALKYALPYLFTLLIFFIVYTSIPNTKVNFRDALLGSIIATRISWF
jgi:membrane protein